MPPTGHHGPCLWRPAKSHSRVVLLWPARRTIWFSKFFFVINKVLISWCSYQLDNNNYTNVVISHHDANRVARCEVKIAKRTDANNPSVRCVAVVSYYIIIYFARIHPPPPRGCQHNIFFTAWAISYAWVTIIIQLSPNVPTNCYYYVRGPR